MAARQHMGGRGEFDVTLASVRPQQPQAADEGTLGLQAEPERLDVAGQGGVVQTAAEQSLARNSEEVLGGGICVDGARVVVEHDDGIERRREDRAQLRLAVAQGALEPVAIARGRLERRREAIDLRHRARRVRGRASLPERFRRVHERQNRPRDPSPDDEREQRAPEQHREAQRRVHGLRRDGDGDRPARERRAAIRGVGGNAVAVDAADPAGGTLESTEQRADGSPQPGLGHAAARDDEAVAIDDRPRPVGRQTLRGEEAAQRRRLEVGGKTVAETAVANHRHDDFDRRRAGRPIDEHVGQRGLQPSRHVHEVRPARERGAGAASADTRGAQNDLTSCVREDDGAPPGLRRQHTASMTLERVVLVAIEVQRCRQRLQRFHGRLDLAVDGQRECARRVAQAALRGGALAAAEDDHHDRREDEHRHDGGDHEHQQVPPQRKHRRGFD